MAIAEPTISEVRHLDIKIEYYTIQAKAGTLSIEDTIKLSKLKILREILLLLKHIDDNNEGRLDSEFLVRNGGIVGLRKSADTLQILMKTLSDEEDRLSATAVKDDKTVIQFDNALKVINQKLKKV